jgi:HPt (histidine-containing phosphotransfer) domain-containing protein
VDAAARGSLPGRTPGKQATRLESGPGHRHLVQRQHQLPHHPHQRTLRLPTFRACPRPIPLGFSLLFHQTQCRKVQPLPRPGVTPLKTFRAHLPEHLRAVQGALRDRDAPRLREAAHKLAGMVSAFSTLAGGVASELEDLAAQGQLEEAQPLASRLEAMAEDLMKLVGGLSLDDLRERAGEAGSSDRAAGPGAVSDTPWGPRD